MAELNPITPQQAEEWRPVVGYEGVYEVSNCGRVRAVRPWSGRSANHILAQSQTKGYHYVMLNNRQLVKPKRAQVHGLVMIAFVGPYPQGMEINHRDTNKSNNCLENLEYCTKSENVIHAFAHGLRPMGDEHWTRRQPERLPRGDDHPMRKYPDRVPRGERHGSHTHPESLRRGDDHHMRRCPELVRRGESAPRARLTANKVREIRRRHADGETLTSLGQIFGVTRQSIFAVVHRRTWVHID